MNTILKHTFKLRFNEYLEQIKDSIEKTTLIDLKRINKSHKLIQNLLVLELFNSNTLCNNPDILKNLYYMETPELNAVYDDLKLSMDSNYVYLNLRNNKIKLEDNRNIKHIIDMTSKSDIDYTKLEGVLFETYEDSYGRIGCTAYTITDELHPMESNQIIHSSNVNDFYEVISYFLIYQKAKIVFTSLICEFKGNVRTILNEAYLSIDDNRGLSALKKLFFHKNTGYNYKVIYTVKRVIKENNQNECGLCI